MIDKTLKVLDNNGTPSGVLDVYIAVVKSDDLRVNQLFWESFLKLVSKRYLFEMADMITAIPNMSEGVLLSYVKERILPLYNGKMSKENKEWVIEQLLLNT